MAQNCASQSVELLSLTSAALHDTVDWLSQSVGHISCQSGTDARLNEKSGQHVNSAFLKKQNYKNKLTNHCKDDGTTKYRSEKIAHTNDDRVLDYWIAVSVVTSEV